MPFDIEITLQSLGDDEGSIPINMWNMYITEREVVLSEKYGTRLNSYTIVLVDDKGETLSWGQYFPDDDKIPFPIGSTKLSKDDTVKVLNEKFNLYGMTLENVTISNDIGKNGDIQILTMDLSVPDLYTANLAFPKFFSSLRPSIEYLNSKEATRIAVCHIEIFDVEGRLLISYILDLEMTKQMWWNVDEITATWYPQPADPEVTPVQLLETETVVDEPVNPYP